MNQTKRICVLGAGTMGRALTLGLLRSGEARADQVVATRRQASRTQETAEELGVEVHTDNPRAVRSAELVVLGVKPHAVSPVLAELAREGALDHRPLVVSIAAGVRTGTLEERVQAEGVDGLRVVRAMPNTPSLVGEGMTVLAPGRNAGPEDLARVERLFLPLGRVRTLEEEHLDAVTGLSASGPAFVYVIIEALAEGGVMMGLPRGVATELAAQAVRGASSMVLETGRHTAALKDEVMTPAGCTISALLALEDGKLRSVLARGVQAAAQAAAELG